MKILLITTNLLSIAILIWSIKEGREWHRLYKQAASNCKDAQSLARTAIKLAKYFHNKYDELKKLTVNSR